MGVQMGSSNPYPRPPLIRGLRWIARFSYLTFLIIPGNVLFNLVQLALSDNFAALSDWNKVSKALLIGKLVLLLRSEPAIVVAPVAIIVAIVFVGRLAHRDREREREWIQQAKARAMIEEISRITTQGVLTRTRQRQNAGPFPILLPEPPAAEPQGPPHDNLKSAEGHFVGRAAELRQLLEWLRAPDIPRIVAITGIGGIGKTALAAEAITFLTYEDTFPGGIGAITAQEQMNTITVIREALQRFDPLRKQPPATTTDELQNAARRLLAGKHVLIVIDNVEPGLNVAAVLRPLADAGAKILVTTREGERTGTREGARSQILDQLPDDLQQVTKVLPLGALSHDEAVELFTKEAGPGDVHDWSAAQRTAVDQIVTSLREHTLAVKLAARYVREEGVDVTRLARELDDPEQVTRFGGDIDSIYQKSRNTLTPVAQRLFRQCGSFATAEFSVQAAMAVASRFGDEEPAAAIDLLLRRGLVSSWHREGYAGLADADRIQLHPVLFGFARQESEHASETERSQTQLAIAEYYATYSTYATSTYRDALALDERNIEGALDWAYTTHHAEPFARMCVGMQAFWRDYGRKAARERYLPLGFEAAQELVRSRRVKDARELLAWLKLGNAQFLRLQGKVREAARISGGILRDFIKIKNLSGQGSTLVLLANIARDQSRPDEAERYLNQALDVFTDPRVNDPAYTALVLSFRGQVRERAGTRNAEADADLAASYDLYASIGNNWGRGLALQLRGRISLRRGLLSEAYERYSDALAIHQRLQARRHEAVDISSFGQIACGRGEYGQASTRYEQSLAIRRESGDRRGEAVDLTLFGQLYRIREQYEPADQYLASALAIWRGVDEPRGIGWTESEQGQLALAQSHAGRAEKLLREALALHRKADDVPAQAVTLVALGNTRLLRGRVSQAQSLFERASRLAASVEDPVTQGRAIRGLAVCAERAQDLSRAQALLEQSLTLVNRSELPLPHAETMAALGQLLKRTGRDGERGEKLLMDAERIYTVLRT